MNDFVMGLIFLELMQKHSINKAEKQPNRQQIEYNKFVSYYEERGYSFPCTTQQLYTRIREYTDNTELRNMLCGNADACEESTASL